MTPIVISVATNIPGMNVQPRDQNAMCVERRTIGLQCAGKQRRITLTLRKDKLLPSPSLQTTTSSKDIIPYAEMEKGKVTHKMS